MNTSIGPPLSIRHDPSISAPHFTQWSVGETESEAQRPNITHLQLACSKCGLHVCMHACACAVVSDSLQLMDCSPPGSSVHGILQARILEWVAISYSRRPTNPGLEPRSLALPGRFFTTGPPRES